MDIDTFLKKLSQDGITDVKMEQNNNNITIVLQNDDTKIEINDKTTHILCDNKPSFRLKLRDLLLQCIQSF